VKYTGTYILGLGMASGKSAKPGVSGTLTAQFEALDRQDHPNIEELLVFLSKCYLGTLNVKVAAIVSQPDWRYVLKDVDWHPDFPPEDLHFHPVRLFHEHREYDALWYRGSGRLHGGSVIEVVSPWVENLKANRSMITIADAI